MGRHTREPYRMFFSLALLYGLWGVLIWVPFALGRSGSYVGPLHAQVMMGGFLGAFAFGFLTTAVPRFTQSFPLRAHEMVWIMTPLLALPFLALADSLIWIQLALLAAFSGVVKFAVLRFRQGHARPPPPFVFIGIGIGSAVIGCLLQITALLVPELPGSQLGRLLFLHGFILSLVVGVGSRLVPVLLGRGPVPSTPCLDADTDPDQRRLFAALGAVFIASFVTEAFISATAGRAIRAALVSFVGFQYWHLGKFPLRRTKVAWGVWAAGHFINAGLWGAVFAPALAVHFHHLSFISGLSLMTFMVATRVVLAHGGYDLELEGRLNSLYWVAGIFALAGLTRFAAGISSRIYMSHLMYAAVLWAIGLCAWAAVIGWRMLRPLPGSS